MEPKEFFDGKTAVALNGAAKLMVDLFIREDNRTQKYGCWLVCEPKQKMVFS